MNKLKKLIRQTEVSNVRYTESKLIQYAAFSLVPALFWAFNDFVILKSISAYALEIPTVFALILGWVAKLFITEGWINRKNYFEMVIGWALVGVIAFNMKDYSNIHYICAFIFFEGSVFNMIYYSSGKYRIFSIVFGVILNFAMAGCFLFGWYSIFWAEWIGLLPISLHKFLETIKIID